MSRVGVGGGVFGQTGLPLDGGTITGALTLQSTLAVTGAVTMSSTLAVTGAMTLESTLVQTKDAIGTGATAGNTLRNTTDAAAGAQQYSPMFVLTGEGWKTDATAATQVWDWAQQNRPVEGAAASTSALHWLSQVAGGGYTSRANLSSAGAFTASGALAAGAATPGPYLYVKGPTDITSYARVDDSTGSVQTIFGANSTDGFAGTLSNHRFVFRTNNTDRFTITNAGATDFKPDGTNIKLAISSTGLGFFGAGAAAQPAGIANADGTLADITTKFNTLITALETLGLIATV